MPDPDHYRIYSEKYAAAFFDGGPLPNAYRPPLYPILLSPIVRLLPSPTFWIAVLHIGLAVATLSAVWKLASLQSPVVATLAGLITAVDPILAFQSGQIMTEIPFTTFMIWALVPWLNPETPTMRSACLSGILAGVAFLTRPTMAPLLLAVGASLLIQRRSLAFQRWMIASFVAFLIATPWAIRNQVVLGRPIFGTTHGGYTLWLANNWSFHKLEVKGGENWAGSPDFEWWTKQNEESAPLGELERDKAFQEAAVRWMYENPADAAKAAVYRFTCFWGLLPRTGGPLARAIVVSFYLFLFLSAAVGWLTLRSWRGPWLTATMVVVALSLVHTVYWSNMRFRAPIEPLLAIWAAAGVEWIARRIRPATNDI